MAIPSYSSSSGSLRSVHRAITTPSLSPSFSMPADPAMLSPYSSSRYSGAPQMTVQSFTPSPSISAGPTMSSSDFDSGFSGFLQMGMRSSTPNLGPSMSANPAMSSPYSSFWYSGAPYMAMQSFTLSPSISANLATSSLVFDLGVLGSSHTAMKSFSSSQSRSMSANTAKSFSASSSGFSKSGMNTQMMTLPSTHGEMSWPLLSSRPGSSAIAMTSMAKNEVQSSISTLNNSAPGEPAPKRKAGRPIKYVSESSSDGTAAASMTNGGFASSSSALNNSVALAGTIKRRGRPPKEQGATASSVLAAMPEMNNGLSSSSSTLDNSMPLPGTTKRKPGRPRKHPLPVPQQFTNSSNGDSGYNGESSAGRKNRPKSPRHVAPVRYVEGGSEHIEEDELATADESEGHKPTSNGKEMATSPSKRRKTSTKGKERAISPTPEGPSFGQPQSTRFAYSQPRKGWFTKSGKPEIEAIWPSEHSEYRLQWAETVDMNPWVHGLQQPQAAANRGETAREKAARKKREVEEEKERIQNAHMLGVVNPLHLLLNKRNPAQQYVMSH